MTANKWTPYGGMSLPWVDESAPPRPAPANNARNGLPELPGYRYQRKHQAHEAEFAARLAALRARFPYPSTDEEST